MSQENVEIVKQVYEATARRDAGALAALYAPDVEWDDSGTPPGELESRGAGRGHEALQAWFRAWHEAWEDLSYDLEELIDAGEQVISITVFKGRGRASGLEVERLQYGVWTIRNRKIVRALWFQTKAEALEAAGLSE